MSRTWFGIAWILVHTLTVSWVTAQFVAWFAWKGRFWAGFVTMLGGIIVGTVVMAMISKHMGVLQ